MVYRPPGAGRVSALGYDERRGIAMLRVVLACIAVLALAGTAGAEEQVSGTAGDDHFAAGDKVTVEKPVAGDTFVAAGRSELRGSVEGDAVVTGGEVDLTGDVGHDAYAAGGLVRVAARIAGNLRAAGGEIRLGPTADITGNATLAGGSIRIEGRIGRALTAYGGDVELDADVAGDAEIAAEQVVIGPKTRVGGRLVYTSHKEARIDPAAQIAGGVERRDDSARSWKWHDGLGHTVSAVGQFFLFLGVLVLGTLLLFVFPQFTRESAALVRSDPLASIVLGFAVLVAVPMAIVLSFITIVGIPLGIAALFGYGLLLMLGYLNGALAVGDALLVRLGEPRASQAGWRVVFLLVALVALMALRHLPWLGTACVFVVFIAGLGAWTQRAWRGFRPAAAAN